MTNEEWRNQVYYVIHGIRSNPFIKQGPLLFNKYRFTVIGFANLLLEPDNDNAASN